MTYSCGTHLIQMTQSELLWSVFGEAHLIAQFLTTHEVLCVSGTCKLLQSYYDKQIEIFRVADDCDNELNLKKLCLRLSRVKTVDFLNSRYHNWKSLIFISLSFLASIKNIVSLCIRVTSEPHNLRYFLQHTAPKTIELSIHWGNTNEIDYILEPLEDLEEISLRIFDKEGHNFFYIVNVLSKCYKTLTKFTLEVSYRCTCTRNNCECKFSGVMEYLLQKCTKLRYLEINVPCIGENVKLVYPNTSISCLKIINVMVNSIEVNSWSALSRLETLHIDDSLSPTFVISLAKLISSCRELKLKRFSMVSTWKSRWSCNRDNLVSLVLNSLLQGSSKDTLENLNLSGHFLCSDCTECLGMLIPQLKCLNVHNCTLRASTLNITNLLTTANSLVEINVSNWYTHDNQTSKLMLGVIHLKCIQTINLSNNCISSESVKVLPRFLTSIRDTIININIDLCVYSVTDLEEIWKCFAACGMFKRLKSIHCKTWCTITSEECLRALSLLLRVVPQLRFLSIPPPTGILKHTFINLIARTYSLSRLIIHSPYKEFIHEKSERLMYTLRRAIGSRRLQISVS